MRKELNIIKQINSLLENYTDITDKVLTLTDKIEDLYPDIATVLYNYATQYATLNKYFASDVIILTLQAYKSDKDEKLFNDIIKDLKEDVDDE